MALSENNRKLKILISPLDWGLGHASRCIPLINRLLEDGHEVSIGGSGNSLALLQKEFPTLSVIDLPGFSPVSGKKGFTVLRLIYIAINLIINTFKEYFLLNKMLATAQIDILISDNRYGLFSKNVKSIILTHQLMVKLPRGFRWFEKPVHYFIKMLVCNFDECWIPDFFESPGLSGELAHKYALPANAKFIGPLSRFTAFSKQLNKKARYAVTAILSGPDPQRSNFEKLLINELMNLEKESCIISGQPLNSTYPLVMDKLHVIPFATGATIFDLITQSEVVICRSGYTSVMDICAVGCKALLIPTPGQTEQLYLAKLHSEAGNAIRANQQGLNILSAIEKSGTIKGFDFQYNDEMLLQAIRSITS